VAYPPNWGLGASLVHRLHDRAHDPRKDRAAAGTADCIAEEATQRPACSRIGTRSAPKQSAEKSGTRNTADPAANDLRQLGHRHLLQDCADGLTA
jgi:hypothetical protein